MNRICDNDVINLDVFVGFAPEERSLADALIGRLIGLFDGARICHSGGPGSPRLEERLQKGIAQSRFVMLLSSKSWSIERMIAGSNLDKAAAADKTVMAFHFDPPENIPERQRKLEFAPLNGHQHVILVCSLPRPDFHARLDEVMDNVLMHSRNLPRNGLAEAPMTFHAPATPHMLATLPTRKKLHGRMKELEHATALLEGGDCNGVFIEGMAGAGRSAMLQAIIHDPTIAIRFCIRRCFLRATRIGHIVRIRRMLATSMGIDPPGETPEYIERLLEEQPTLIVVDDLGRGMEPGRAAALTGELLDLVRRTGAKLVASAVDSDRFVGADIDRVVLARLDEVAVRDILFAIASHIAGNDADLPHLVEQIDGNPLALRMLASRCCCDDTLESTRRELSDAAQSLGDNATPVTTTLLVALRRTDLRQEVRAVIDLLADGLNAGELATTLPPGGFLALTALMQAGIATCDRGEYQVSPGIIEALERMDTIAGLLKGQAAQA
ncbi:MAG: hypothetical protein KDG54_05870 [Geminicoccaceae bacterium]|nr:hypothetical protein [Geminicoccaceae bacterium]